MQVFKFSIHTSQNCLASGKKCVAEINTPTSKQSIYTSADELHSLRRKESFTMKKAFIGVLACASCLWAASSNREEAEKRLNEASATLSEIMSAPDKGIPQDLLDRAKCAVIVPGVKKGAFIVGASFGKGFITCRGNNDRGWSAPAAIRMEGGSFGFQIGGSETDVVMLVMNDRGADRLMQDKFTVGGEGEVAAGPVGRTASAQTDAKMSAEMLSWSRSRGVFAGIALKGATMRPDREENEAMYGKPMGTKEVIDSHATPTAAAARLLSTLGGTSPREKR
jgi:lipid-binding SYLF domain-containing protein